MKQPVASLCSLALALWGFQTGFWIIAIPMIMLLEGRHVIQKRWTLSLEKLKGLFKLSGVILGLLSLGLLITEGSYTLIYPLLQCLPLCCFPLIVAQLYTTNTSTLIPRLISRNPPRKAGRAVNLSYLYFAVCLLAASAANGEGHFFYVAITLGVASMLWTLRPKRSNLTIWVCLILITSGLGWVGHLQLSQLQVTLEQKTAPWLSGVKVDPYQAVTQMGSIGALKQSNAIVFRVAQGEGASPSFPLLIRDAIYNKYGAGSWVAMKSKFAPVSPNPHHISWTLGPSGSNPSSIIISDHLHGKEGVLKLPNGTSEISRLPVTTMNRNQYGTVKVKGRSGGIAYQVDFDTTRSLDSPPTEADLEVPEKEKDAIAQALSTLEIRDRSPSEIVDQVSAFFLRGFHYSLVLPQPKSSSTSLSEFLLTTQTGHCEYFASATTLMLRKAGIPARYAVGYSVHEFSPMEGQYIARSRNAHAWTLAYVDGTWKTVDTTPPNWMAQEDTSASPLQQFSDFWSFLMFQVVQGIDSLRQGHLWVYSGMAIALIGLAMLLKRRQKLRLGSPNPISNASSQNAPLPDRIGLDSEFYAIERRLEDTALARQPSESLQQWMARLKPQLSTSDYLTLQKIMELHYRYRFDPQGLEASERKELRGLSQSWLRNASHLTMVHDTTAQKP